jgi:hypothetical protein
MQAVQHSQSRWPSSVLPFLTHRPLPALSHRPLCVVVGEGRPSTACDAGTDKGVDGRPSPTTTGLQTSVPIQPIKSLTTTRARSLRAANTPKRAA